MVWDHAVSCPMTIIMKYFKCIDNKIRAKNWSNYWSSVKTDTSGREKIANSFYFAANIGFIARSFPDNFFSLSLLLNNSPPRSLNSLLIS